MNTHGLRFLPLSGPVFQELKTRAAFELGKWDQQYVDHPSLADYVITLDPAVYRQLASWASALAGELFRAEREILAHPDLLDLLALPRAIRRALRHQPIDEGRATRLCRFDFHPTENGWQISEVNSDVPGGLLESDGMPALLAGAFDSTSLLPDTTSAYLDALLPDGPVPHPVALVHATAYTDDRQVMLYLQREFEARGQQAILLSPDNLEWQKSGVLARTEWYSGPVARIVRFYPAEWMANLPASCRWSESDGISDRWMSNPLSALISQSKAFPLLWDRLEEPMTTWRQLLPETRSFRRRMLLDQAGWVFKPILGRVGEGILLDGVGSRQSTRRHLLNAALYPRHWIAQRRFRASSWSIDGQPHWPCLGLYTVDEKPAGIYARTARQPLIDGSARDTAVFLSAPARTATPSAYETAGTL